MATAEVMKKTSQVRIAEDLADDLAIVATSLRTTVSQYVEDVLRAAVARDIPQAARAVKERADALKKGKGREEEGGAK